jgi:hypothetical protein
VLKQVVPILTTRLEVVNLEHGDIAIAGSGPRNGVPDPSASLSSLPRISP